MTAGMFGGPGRDHVPDTLATRIRWIVIGGLDDVSQWVWRHPDINPRDVVRITAHRDLHRIRGHRLNNGNWRVVRTGTEPVDTPWREYLEFAGWDGTLDG